MDFKIFNNFTFILPISKESLTYYRYYVDLLKEPLLRHRYLLIHRWF